MKILEGLKRIVNPKVGQAKPEMSHAQEISSNLDDSRKALERCLGQQQQSVETCILAGANGPQFDRDAPRVFGGLKIGC